METVGLRRIPVQDRKLHTLHYRLDGGDGLETLLAAVDLGPRRVGAGLRVRIPPLPHELPVFPQDWSVGDGPAQPVWSPEELCAVRSLHEGPYDRFDLSDALHGVSLAVSRDVLLQIHTAAGSPDVAIQDLQEAVGRHPALVVRLLTVLPARCEVHAIGAALSYLGTRQLRLWLSLFSAQACGVDGFGDAKRDAELARTVAAEVGVAPSKAYLVGLLSSMAAESDRPLRGFLDELSLAQDLRRGMLRKDGPIGRLLRLVGRRSDP